MLREFPALLAAGVLLALLEIAYAIVHGRTLFLSMEEQLRYAAVALTVLPVTAVLAGLVLRVFVTDPKRVRWGAVAALLVGGKLAHELTMGRRVRDLAIRPVLVVLAALCSAGLAFAVLRAVSRHRARGGVVPWRGAWVVLPVSGLLWADHQLFSRAYPAFHTALELAALGAVTLTALSLRGFDHRPTGLLAALAAAMLAAFVPSRLAALRVHPNASYVVEHVAPWSKRALVASYSGPERRASVPARAVQPVAASAAPAVRGLDLRDRDVLLITIDALRADQLQALGGAGNTPQLDALGRQGVVFRRAYTPAPHTSYALSSLLTGKFIKPVLEMDGVSLDQVTLPDLLRRYGYRTAAFYPPAIFFVDGSRFAGLRERHFGFEYQKEMYATGEQRVAQLEAYLATAEPGHPLFVWVHLFEPHEPYDPPAEWLRDDSQRGRYEGEVRAADAAAGQLIAAFRRARHDATVIVTGDHGEEFGEHGGHYHGTSLFEEQARVPLVWSSPGAAVPRAVEVPVELVDVATTLLSAAGIPRDARMLGDDLGAVLAGNEPSPAALAFAAVDDRHMVTDGRLKLICVAKEDRCQLFDLSADPAELRNVIAERAADAERLRTGLDHFLASIPRVEAMAVADGVAWPAALARAKLGAPGVGPDVVPLLSDARPEVRRAALEALGALDYRPAAQAVERLRAVDPDERVRAEAAVTALLLGVNEAAEQCLPLLAARDGDGLSLARRAALALAAEKSLAAVPVLLALASDGSADEQPRTAAIDALGRIGDPRSARLLAPLLGDVRLRIKVAEALGAIGGKAAADALAQALQTERYQPARTAEARALVKLKDPRARVLIERFLGMETGLPGGVELLWETGGVGSRGTLLTAETARHGRWSCDEAGCVPGANASLTLSPRGKGPVRLTLLVQGSVGAQLAVADQTRRLKAEKDELSFLLPSAREAARLKVAPSPVRLWAAVAVPAVAELPPPPPEPWQQAQVSTELSEP